MKLENSQLSITIHEMGAELRSIIDKENNEEIMW